MRARRRNILVAVLVWIGWDAAASGEAGHWPDPVANDVIPYQTSPMTHGPVLGNLASDSVRVWIRTEEPMSFDVLYGKDLPLEEGDACSFVRGETSGDADATGWVELAGLDANERYYYGVRIDGELADTRMEFDRAWPSFRTLPDETSFADAEGNPEGLFNFSFSTSVGQRQRSPGQNYGIYGNPPAFLTLWKEHGEDVFFHIVNGDYTYEELLDGTSAGYANNYKLYLDRGRNVSNFLRYVPMFTMYDDHEVNSNLDGAGEVGLGDGDYLVRDAGIKVWQDYAEWANGESGLRGELFFGEAKLEGDILYDANADFTMLQPDKVSTIHVGNYIKGDGRSKKERGGANVGVYGLVEVVDGQRLRLQPGFKQAGKASYSIGTHHYFDRVIGNCHFFFLDGRGQRSKFLGAERSHDDDRFILGKTQREWFLEGVKATDADFIFVVFPDPWVMYHTAHHVRPGSLESKGDGFAGYVWEREEMMPVLDGIEKPVIILTGDLHHPFAVQVTDNVWEFLTSPVNSAGHPMGTAGLPPLGGWFDSEGRAVKIKWGGGYPDNVHYLRQRSIVYTVVQVNNVVKAGRPEGPGYQWIAFDEPQLVVKFYDGYTGKLLYAEGISTADAKSSQEPAPKVSRFPEAAKP